jgi:vacuolar-type H+-ATPase subunit E/Vma4
MPDAKAASDPKDVLSDEVLGDAKRQAARLLDHAKREAADILEKAKKEAEADRAQRRRQAEAESARRRDLVLAAVPIQEARQRSARVEEVLDSVRESALAELRSGKGFSREEAVALAAEAIGRMEGDRFAVEIPPALREAGSGLAADIRRRLNRQRVEIAVAHAQDSGVPGVVVQSEDGRQVWDNRLEARLNRMWPELRRQVAARLPFGASGDAGKGGGG